MTNLWQNLHDFYTQQFPNLQVFGQNYTKNQSQNQGQIYQIDEITDIWNELYPRVYGYFWRRIENQSTVEDLTANTLSSFLINVQNGKIARDNFGYLWQIARNYLFEYCRRKPKSFISLTDFDEDFVDEKLANRNAELIEKIKFAAQKCLKNDEFTMFCDYYSSDLGSKPIFNSQNSSNNSVPNSDNLTDKYNLKPATLRQKIHRIKLKLQKELVKQK